LAVGLERPWFRLLAVKLVWPKTPLAANTVVGGGLVASGVLNCSTRLLSVSAIYKLPSSSTPTPPPPTKNPPPHKVLAVGALNPWLQEVAVKVVCPNT
jgi:hypothetical protein